VLRPRLVPRETTAALDRVAVAPRADSQGASAVAAGD
jgi:hypothetical protein